MVGVPGRSKACKTCKQRKIACSLETPQCQNCIKAKRECGGYHQERIFVMDPRMESKKPKPRAKNSNRTTQPESLDVEEAVLTFSNISVYRPQSPKLQATIPTSSAFSLLTSISSPSTRAIYRSQILSEFLDYYLPARKSSTAGSWLALLPSHPTYTPALESTALAISTSRLGRSHNDTALIRESLKFYVQGLRELQKALWDEKLMYRDETLAACMLLVMYEVFECPDGNIKGWEGHMKGCARLFEARGPYAYVEKLGRTCFLSFRQLEIQNALTERRKTFLAEKKWMEGPWAGQTKPSSHCMLDLMAELAGVVAAGYQVLGDPTSISDIGGMITAMTEVLKDSWKLDTQLSAFFKRLETEARSQLYSEQPSSSSNNLTEIESGSEAFAITFQFPDATTAYTCVLYWTTCAILWSGMSFIYRFLSALPSLTSDSSLPEPFIHPILALFPSLDHRIAISEPAKKISTSVVFPLKVAIEALNGDSTCEKELKWAENAFQKISGKGVKILEHLGVKLTDRNYLPG